jgi:hypothetical protein
MDNPEHLLDLDIVVASMKIFKDTKLDINAYKDTISHWIGSKYYLNERAIFMLYALFWSKCK